MTDCTKGHETHCRQAKNPPSDCECNCGGTNHGKDYDGPRLEQTSSPIRSKVRASSKPSVPCDRHPTREATTLGPEATPLCDHCADVLSVEKGAP